MNLNEILNKLARRYSLESFKTVAVCELIKDSIRFFFDFKFARKGIGHGNCASFAFNTEACVIENALPPPIAVISATGSSYIFLCEEQ